MTVGVHRLVDLCLAMGKCASAPALVETVPRDDELLEKPALAFENLFQKPLLQQHLVGDVTS